jgi:hypothetical protein
MRPKYEIGKEWSNGFSAAIQPSAIDETASSHWMAGYTAGYEMRKIKNEKLNEYLVSIRSDPMFTVHLCKQSAS